VLDLGVLVGQRALDNLEDNIGHCGGLVDEDREPFAMDMEASERL